MKYKAVMLDADNTLWKATHSPAEVWQSILSDMEIETNLQELEAATTSSWTRFAARYRRLETSGSPNSDSEIRGFWLDVDSALLDELGLHLNLDVVERKASWRFTQVFRLFPETRDVIAYLSPQYQLAIVSNNSEPLLKARSLGIGDCFDVAIGSIHVGHRKPKPEIFDIALSALNVRAEEAVMVGDNWGEDIVGAMRMGITALHLKRKTGKLLKSSEISDLWGLVRFLSGRRRENDLLPENRSSHNASLVG